MTCRPPSKQVAAIGTVAAYEISTRRAGSDGYTLLPSGKVLVAGGTGNSGELSSAELFDPSTGTWTTTGTMVDARIGHTATLLPSDQVLVAGGTNDYPATQLPSAELHNPSTGSWTATGSMAKERYIHTATLLPSGKVLVAGGTGNSDVLSSAELYDAPTDSWTTTGSMVQGRSNHTATLLTSGRVLVAGGYNNNGIALSSAELFDHTAGEICASSLNCASGLCIDGICCEAACQETCKECAVQSTPNGTFGHCVNIAAGQPDLNATIPCSGTGLCDGNGVCKQGNGITCTDASKCGSGFCIDGVCCENECTETCKACNVQGNEGACSPLPTSQQDTNAASLCVGSNACDGIGNCKLASGQPCSNAADCATGFCVDQTCCSTACDKTCESCGLQGSEGTCSPITANTDPDSECIGIDPACGGACNGQRACEFPGIGTTCGLCKACDGTGRCNSVPPDDDACGVIDCDELDTTCRDYEDIKYDRCASFGVCKEANVAVTCTQFTELACGDAGVVADAAVGVEAGAMEASSPNQDTGQEKPEGDDAGCSCHLGQTSSQDASLPLFTFLLVLGLPLARRREC